MTKQDFRMKNLFGEEDFDPQEEWKDMPEFIQDHKKTIKQVLIPEARAYKNI